MVHGPDAGLAATHKLTGNPTMRDYCYLPAVRGHLLEQAGHAQAARREWLQAAALTRNERERQLYLRHAHRQAE